MEQQQNLQEYPGEDITDSVLQDTNSALDKSKLIWLQENYFEMNFQRYLELKSEYDSAKKFFNPFVVLDILIASKNNYEKMPAEDYSHFVRQVEFEINGCYSFINYYLTHFSPEMPTDTDFDRTQLTELMQSNLEIIRHYYYKFTRTITSMITDLNLEVLLVEFEKDNSGFIAAFTAVWHDNEFSEINDYPFDKKEHTGFIRGLIGLRDDLNKNISSESLNLNTSN